LQAAAIRVALERLEAPVATAVILGAPLGCLLLAAALRGAVASAARLWRRLVWWHFLWALLFLSDLIIRVRDANQIMDSPVDGWAAYRIALVGAVGFVLVARLAAGHSEWLRSLVRGLPGLLSLYAAVSLLSTFWSVYPAWTLYKSGEYLIDIALVAAVLAGVRSDEEFKSLFDWTWLLLGALIIAVWAGVAVWPAEAIKRDVGLLGFQINGVMPQVAANGVGELGALAAVIAFCRLIQSPWERRYRYVVVFGVALLTVAFAQTRSAITGFLVGAAAVLFFSRRVGITAFLLILIGVLAAQTSAADLLWNYFRRGQSEQMFGSLSGRVDWWRQAWDRFMMRPWSGYGAYAGGRFAVLAETGQGATSSLHNTYLEILVGTSLWGLAPVLAALAGTWWRLVRAPGRPLAVEAIGVLSVLTVRSVFTAHLIWHPALPFLLVLGYAEYLRRGWKEPFYA